MTETLTLGSGPLPQTVVLTRRADYILTLHSEDGDWPDGIVVSIVFNDPDATTWVADVTGADLDWNVDKADVETLVAALPENHARFRVTYVDGPVDLTWYSGAVAVRE